MIKSCIPYKINIYYLYKVTAIMNISCDEFCTIEQFENKSPREQTFELWLIMVKEKSFRNKSTKQVTCKNGFTGNIKFNCSRSWTYMCAKGIPIIGFLLITIYLIILSFMIIIFCVFYVYMQGHLTIFIQWGSELIEKIFQIFFTIFTIFSKSIARSF